MRCKSSSNSAFTRTSTEIGTRAYPTGFNKLPSLYVWNGTLPYTTNGTTACATANSDSTSLLTYTVTTTVTLPSNMLSTSTYFVTQTVTGATPLPSVDNLPTQSVYDLDEQDPKGWTYCYDFGEPSSPKENFFSLFTGDLFDQVRQNCTPDGMTPAPLVVVDAAAFLLDETTSYIDNTKTEPSETLRSRTVETSQTSTSVRVDPFQTTPTSLSAQKSTSSEKAETKISETKPSETKPPTTSKLAQTPLPLTISRTLPDQPVSDKESVEPVQTTVPSSSFKEPSATATATKPSAQDTEIVNNASQQNPATSSGVQPKVKSSVAVQTIATSGGVQIDALNSLIQDIGQLQSSSHGNVIASAARPSNEMPSHTSDTTVAATTPALSAPIVIGTSTATANSDGNYMIGTHALQPTDSHYELQGTTYALDSSKSVLIVNAISTYVVAPAQHASDVHQAATLTINGVTVTPNPASNYVVETQTLKPGGPAITVSGTRISLASNAATVAVGSQTSALSTTMGIGDYVWAGLAGMLSAASDSASALSSTADEEPSNTGNSASSPSSSTVLKSSQSSSTEDETLLSTATSTASDSETAVDDNSASLSTATDPSSTRTSILGDVSQQQTPTSSTTPDTTLQAGPDSPDASSSFSYSLSSPAPSPSSSSSSIQVSSENNAGRVDISASLAICILSLVVTVLA